jgi:hypothetical protein
MAEYKNKHGKEDPRVIESFDTFIYKDGIKTRTRMPIRVNYLINNTIYNYFWEHHKTYDADTPIVTKDMVHWNSTSTISYDGSTAIPGLTKVLNSKNNIYDAATHEYLGDYLRFLRDYHDIDLMPLYNCFSNKIYNNVFCKVNGAIFDSQDPNYRIYAFPVKLFANYTIAIDCDSGVEIFCGLYSTALDGSSKNTDLIEKTYSKYSKTLFNQPFLYDKLDVKFWKLEDDIKVPEGGYTNLVNDKKITRFDIANREQDLKLFIKVPAKCRSTVTVLEGDYVGYNDYKYTSVKYDSEDNEIPEQDTDTLVAKTEWEYRQNHAAVNFGDKYDKININESCFTPITKLQLLAINTGESYPFSDRLVEYLSGSAITPIDPIADNIKRAQKVMGHNKHYFKVDGVWENKMQKIIYDYIINSGPITVTEENKLTDRHRGHNPKHNGYHRDVGHRSKSSLYDVLGYVDKEAEKWYASRVLKDGRIAVRDNIQNVNIYGDLYDV